MRRGRRTMPPCHARSSAIQTAVFRMKKEGPPQARLQQGVGLNPTASSVNYTESRFGYEFRASVFDRSPLPGLEARVLHVIPLLHLVAWSTRHARCASKIEVPCGFKFIARTSTAEFDRDHGESRWTTDQVSPHLPSLPFTINRQGGGLGLPTW